MHSYSFFPAPSEASKGCTRSSPTEGATFFPDMAVTTSGKVAGLEEQDGTGIAQSDTQQVSFCFLPNVPYWFDYSEVLEARGLGDSAL